MRRRKKELEYQPMTLSAFLLALGIIGNCYTFPFMIAVAFHSKIYSFALILSGLTIFFSLLIIFMILWKFKRSETL